MAVTLELKQKKEDAHSGMIFSVAYSPDEFSHTTPQYDSKAQAHTRKSETYVRYFYPSGSSVIQKESETDWSQSRTIAKSLTHVSHSKNSHPPSPIE